MSYDGKCCEVTAGGSLFGQFPTVSARMQVSSRQLSCIEHVKGAVRSPGPELARGELVLGGTTGLVPS